MGHDPSLIEGSVSFQFSLEVFGQLSVGVTLLVYTAAVFVHFRKFLLVKFLWFKKIFLKICLLLAVLGLHCGSGFSVVVVSGGLLSSYHGLLTVVASLVAEHGL